MAARARTRQLRVPPGGTELPVVGISFREGQYPDNVDRLRDVLVTANSLTEDQWALKLLKPCQFREAVSKVLVEGQLPVRLVRDRRNPVDPRAVQVWCPFLGDKGFLGYLPGRGNRGRFLEAIADGLDDAELVGLPHPPFKAWVDRVRIHPDHPEHPGITIRVRPWRPRPPGAPARPARRPARVG